MTEYSAGRSRICCRKASAMTSLTTMSLAGLRVLELHHGPPSISCGAELLLRQRIAPVAEAAFGVLHDVALVHQRDGRACRCRSRTASPCAPAARCLRRETGLMPMPEVSGKRILVTPISFMQELDQLLGLVAAGLVLDAGVDVLRVLAEDHHVDLLGLLHRRGHALEVAHRAQADVEVELLAQRDVQRADAAADRRGQRALDRDDVVLAAICSVSSRQPDVRAVDAWSTSRRRRSPSSGSGACRRRPWRPRRRRP